MVLTREVDTSTGKSYPDEILCEPCYHDRDHNLACQCPERFLCVVEADVDGDCVECKDREAQERKGYTTRIYLLPE